MTDIATPPAFTLNDVVVGKTVLRGRSTTGALVTGAVSKIVPGVGFEVLVGLRAFFLWREFAIAAATDVEAGPVMTAATAAAAAGYPDCDFWVAQGVEPLFVAVDSALIQPVDELRRLLEQNRDVAEGLGGAYLAAWKRQFATTELGEAEGDWLTLEDLAGLGIPAGYFIKPDPLLTRQETRRYLLEELERYLRGPLLEDAVTAPAVGPAGRMARLYSVLKANGKLPPGSVSEQMGHVAKWIFTVIQTSLTLGSPSAPTDYEEMAMAFWDVDLLPNKKTIGSYWDYSPFEALRRAPPLTSTEAMADVEDGVPEEDYSDMPPLIPIDSSFRPPMSDVNAVPPLPESPGADAEDEEDYSDMPGLIPLADTIQVENAEPDAEEGEYVAYSKPLLLPPALVDSIGGSVEDLFNFALRPVTIPVWGIALALAILPPLFMNKC
jgi:hypothetical protein